ncbi:MAG TPA: hypothetical protein VFT34_09785 [Verrucomicrobiae bacterium]|nr:hypothetical protein [Verrucomicrobiae bacterium]
MMKTARILVADANSSFLLGAMASLSQLPQVEIVGCNAAASEAIEQVEVLVADVLVLDADTLNLSGWLALRRLLARPKRPRVVVTAEDLDGENCFLARVAGADVCLRKDELRHKLFPMVSAIPPVRQETMQHFHPAL